MHKRLPKLNRRERWLRGGVLSAYLVSVIAGLDPAIHSARLMKAEGLTKSTLAKRTQTSRAQLDRLLDPENESVTLGTLVRAAQAVGRELQLELV